MTWDWGYAASILPDMLAGVGVTVLVTALAAIIALGGGLVLCIVAITGGRAGRIPTWALRVFFKGTPILVLLYFGFYALPQSGITLSSLEIGVLVLGIVYAAYCAEVYRGALLAIPSGTRDACHALSLPPTTVWLKVLIPMAVRRSLAPLMNYVLIIFRQTAFLFAIGLPVLMTRAIIHATETFRYIEPYTMAGLLYLLINFPMLYALRRLERRYGQARSQ